MFHRCILVVLMSCLLTGCYYKITNPESGREYYSTDYKDYKESGSIRFKDKRTGKLVTLSSWEVEKLDKEEYQAAIEKGE